MIDTHCHLTFPHFENRVEKLLEDAATRGVNGAITVSTTSTDALTGLELANYFPNVWCTAGIHPLNCDEPINWDDVMLVARHERCVAFGELGLDKHYDKPPIELQRQVLDEQLQRICESGLQLPLIVHCRNAYEELVPLLQQSGLPCDRMVFHCFTGNAEDARLVLDMGAWISFTGVVTFKNAADVREAALLVPNDRIMIETDAPFLTPEPHRKIRPNEPQYSIDTAKFVASLRNNKWDAFHKGINENTERFFGIPACKLG